MKMNKKRIHEEDEVIEYVKNNKILYNSINASIYLSELEIDYDFDTTEEALKKLIKIIIRVFSKFFPNLNIEKIKQKEDMYYEGKKILKILGLSGDFMDNNLNYENVGFGLFRDSLSLFIDSFLNKFTFDENYVKFKIDNGEIIFYDDEDEEEEDITENLEKMKLK
uniref:Uncharacterized protein n=1 Tax=viral metagenome TaxID=1070528 RepID=A0A6C0AF59_9ZZZZ